MRIRQLDLIRYGHFTDAQVDLPAAAPDIHILVGPNEAGKSTVLAALEDLLFGIPARSPLDFLHSYRDMRIGALLESNGSSLAIRRRKGKKDTLLAEDDTPLSGGEAALGPFLGGASRDRFERMFSLDHERLRRGGQEILEAKGDLGEALFSAGSGFQNLRGTERALDEEAGHLWTKRRSAKRNYYQAEDRLRLAERQISEQTVNVRRWRELQEDLQARRNEHDELGQRIREIEGRLRKLGRIRRVARLVAEKASLEERIEGLGRVTSLPEDARETLRRAEEEGRLATQGAKQRQEDLERARTERAALEWDEALLLRSEDIERLHERRLQVRASRSDLPKREAELTAAVSALTDLARDLGWNAGQLEDVVGRIPSTSTVARLRELLEARAAHLAQIESARQSASEAQERLADVTARRGQARKAADVSRLRSVLAATRQECSDVPSRIRAAERELVETHASAWEFVKRLRPTLESVESAEALSVPSVRDVQEQRDIHHGLDREADRLADQVRDVERAMKEAEESRQRILADERPVQEDEVADLRSKRDEGWLLVRRKYIEGEEVADKEALEFSGPNGSLSWAYEQSVLAADRAADRRAETASAAAQLGQAERAAESLTEKIEALQRELSTVSDRRKAAEVTWRAMWDSAPFEPLSPDSMLPWLATYERLGDAIDQRNRVRRELAALRDRESKAAKVVLSELQALGVDTAGLEKAGLGAILERGADERESQEEAARAGTALETEWNQAETSLEARRRALANEEAEFAEWNADWSKAVGAAGIPDGASPESVHAQIDVIDKMRLQAAEIGSLRDKRIGLIHRDIESFENDVHQLVAALAPDLADQDPDEAAVEMERRLAASREARKIAQAKDKDISELEGRIQKFAAQILEHQGSVNALQAEAQVKDVDALRLAIDRAETARDLSTKRERVLGDLSEGGDGLSIQELEAECHDADLDQALSEESDLRTKVDELRNEQATARDSLRDAEARFREVGGGDAAAIAEAARQDALAEIGEIAQQYVRKRAAALLLQWAVDRNRREQQGPMLRRAGQLFAELTLGSFEALELDFDEEDRARLVGRRPSGERVDVDGMSAGSADQLYLALRVAALEGYSADHSSLPFVADDLFVNFDDRRSGAGFRVLGGLAGNCQVLFLTHHEHLVEVAREALGDRVHVWRLPGDSARTERNGPV